MSCERCEELEEEVAYLRSELGLSQSAADYAKLRAYMRRTGGSDRQAVRFVLALYQAGGRVLSKPQLLDAIPSPSGNDDRSLSLVAVLACHARSALGYDAIESVWGRGYRLSDAARAAIKAVLAEPGAA